MGGIQTLHKVLSVVRREIDRDIKLQHIAVFAAAAAHEGSTQKQISEATGTPEGTTSRLISTLVDDYGLLLKQPHPVEYRAFCIYITKKGKDLLTKLDAILP